MPTLAEKLKNLREKKGWSKYRLSKESGVATTTITKIERGEIYPELETLIKLADTLGVDVSELVAGSKRIKTPEEMIKEIFKSIPPKKRPKILKELIDLVNT